MINTGSSSTKGGWQRGASHAQQWDGPGWDRRAGNATFTCVQRGCDRLRDQDAKLKVSSGGLPPLRTLSPLPDVSSRLLWGSDCALCQKQQGREGNELSLGNSIPGVRTETQDRTGHARWELLSAHSCSSAGCTPAKPRTRPSAALGAKQSEAESRVFQRDPGAKLP